MATHDYIINNDTAANVRSDLNGVLAAIRSSNLSPTEPATLYAGLFWFDTTNDELKIRNEANDAWIVMGKFANNTNTASTPSGSILQFAGTSAPDNWLLCDGSLISRTTYSALFGVIGETYGAGDGSTTFKLPDMRGRVGVGAGLGSGLTNRVVAAEGGAEAHVLTENELAEHTHFTFNSTRSAVTLSGANLNTTHAPYQQHRGQGSDWAYLMGNSAQDADVGLSSVGGGNAAHNNMQPFLVLNHIIKA